MSHLENGDKIGAKAILAYARFGYSAAVRRYPNQRAAINNASAFVKQESGS